MTRVYQIPGSALTLLKSQAATQCATCGFPKVYHLGENMGHAFTPKESK